VYFTLIIFVLYHAKLHALHASEDAMWSVLYAHNVIVLYHMLLRVR